MTSRWFNVTVVLFWLTTMGWLVREKVLPALIVGEPPSYRTLAEDATGHPRPVGWKILLNDRPVGWAISRAYHFSKGGNEFRSRVRLSRIPVTAMTPTWVSSFVRMLQRVGDLPDLRLEVDAVTTLGIDPLGRPVGLNSLATLGYAPPGRSLPMETFNIRMDGQILDSNLQLTVKSGELSYTTTAYLPVDSLMGDALSPQSRLPKLKLGQSWTVPIYNPFRPPSSPLEILQAKVERREEIEWNGTSVSTLVVVLSGDAGSGLSGSQVPRGRDWVMTDGRVVRQELNLGQARLVFERVATDAALDRRPEKPADVLTLRPWWPTGDIPDTPFGSSEFGVAE